jgi:predicted nuclease of predicted toxin-antitoxin system
MLLKLDENLGKRCESVFKSFGHDVATVLSQNLSGTDDRKLISICHTETRALVTLDLDFSNPFEFPPANYSGLAVIRLKANFTLNELEEACEHLAKKLIEAPIVGKLWIVQRDRIRQYEP